jgi:hypothetical protein
MSAIVSDDGLAPFPPSLDGALVVSWASASEENRAIKAIEQKNVRMFCYVLLVDAV